MRLHNSRAGTSIHALIHMGFSFIARFSQFASGQWWIMGFGTFDRIPFAISRFKYSNRAVRSRHSNRTAISRYCITIVYWKCERKARLMHEREIGIVKVDDLFYFAFNFWLSLSYAPQQSRNPFKTT